MGQVLDIAKKEGREEDYVSEGAACSYVYQKYGHRRGFPYALRMLAVIHFMTEYRQELTKDGMIAPAGGSLSEVDEALLRAFAKFDFDENQHFSYPRIRDYVARANKPN